MSHPPPPPTTPSPQAQPPQPVPQPKAAAMLCPYCGLATRDHARCESCKGALDPLSRQATQNAMGPWRLRDERAPFSPGFSLATLRQMIAKGKISPTSVIAGPSTRQFWSIAARAPGVANLLGLCHSCRANVPRDARQCPFCHASFDVCDDRQHLGLGPVHLVPGQSPPEAIAASVERRAPAGQPSTDPARGPIAAPTPPAHAAAKPPPSTASGLGDSTGVAARGPSIATLVAVSLCVLLFGMLALVIAGPLMGLELTIRPAPVESPVGPPAPGPGSESDLSAPETETLPEDKPSTAEEFGPPVPVASVDPLADIRPRLNSNSIKELEQAIGELEAMIADGTAGTSEGEARVLLEEAHARLIRVKARDIP